MRKIVIQSPYPIKASVLIRIDGNSAIVYSSGYHLYFVKAEGLSWNPPVTIMPSSHLDITSLDAIVLNGSPAIVYYNAASGYLSFIVAKDKGESWPDHGTYITNTQVNAHPSLAVINGNPAVAYTDSNTSLRYRRANDSMGSNWSNHLILFPTSNPGSFISLTVINEFPAVAYINNQKIYYFRANDINGSYWKNPHEFPIPSNLPNFPLSLTQIGSYPAIAFQSSDLLYTIAKDSEGNSWEFPVIIAGDYNQDNISFKEGSIAYGTVLLIQKDITWKKQIIDVNANQCSFNPPNISYVKGNTLLFWS